METKQWREIYLPVEAEMDDYYEEVENPYTKLSALRVADNQLVHAAEVTKKDGPFYCPDTYGEVIVRKCTTKVDHFAYKARLSPTGGKESCLHLDCKEELLAVLQKAYPEGKWEKERETFTANRKKGYKKVRPDLSGRIRGRGLIIEIQASALSIKKILRRTAQYTKRNAFILWIVPLEEELGTEIFMPRLFERFLHTMYYGRVYYWYRGNGAKLIPVHYGMAQRYIEANEWYNTGGYYKDYKIIKTPQYGEPVDLTRDFAFHRRATFDVEHSKLSIPACNIYMDKKSIWWERD